MNKLSYLTNMGIDVWQQRSSVTAAEPEPESMPATSSLDWGQLEAEISNCSLCELHKTRNNVVFGVGSKTADLLIIGEAPGATEDAKGEPFVGRAGQLLDAILVAIKLQRADVFIANILKCRPPNNRDPLPDEVKLCTSYLKQQIELLKPKLIVAVGRIAANFLLNTSDSMANLRGKTYSYGEQQTPLLVTYHPAYLLRSPREKAKAYLDWQKAAAMLSH